MKIIVNRSNLTPFSPPFPHGTIAAQFTTPAENNHVGKSSAIASGTSFTITYADMASSANLVWRRSSCELFKSSITLHINGRCKMAANNHIPKHSISAFIDRYPHRYGGVHKTSQILVMLQTLTGYFSAAEYAVIHNFLPFVIKAADNSQSGSTYEKNHGIKATDRLAAHSNVTYNAIGNHISSIWFWSSLDLFSARTRIKIRGRNSTPRINHSVRHTANRSIDCYPRFAHSYQPQSDRKPQQGTAPFSPALPHGIIADQFTTPAENNHEGNISATAMGTHFAITYTDPASNTNLDWRCSSREFFKSVNTSIRSGRSAMAASNHMPSTSISAFTDSHPRFINSHSPQSDRKPQHGTAPFELVIAPYTKKPPCTNARRLCGFIFQLRRVAEVTPINIRSHFLASYSATRFPLNIDRKRFPSTAITAGNMTKLPNRRAAFFSKPVARTL